MVIDDDDVVLTATAELLEQAGYRVLTRNRPAGCVAMILQEKPDLVLLDVCMPTVSGDTLVKLFARASPNSKTIVLLYSALDEPLLRSKAKAAGAHGYVMKSHEPATLLRAMKQWLRGSLSDTRLPRVTQKISHASLPAVESPQQSTSRRRVDAWLYADREIDIRTAPAESSKRLSGPYPSPVHNSGAYASPRVASGSYSLETPTVLLVDDEMLVLSGYRRQLQGQPFHLEFALSGAQCLRLLTSATPPSVVVSDLLMPDPGGAEVLRRALDQDEGWSRRFVIITAQSLHDARKQLDPRFRGIVLRKPVDTEALNSAINTSLATSGLLRVPESLRTRSL